MSLLIFSVSPERIELVNDSVAADLDGNPMGFTSKCFTFPHLDMAMVVTGTSSLALEWATQILGGLPVQNMEQLNAMTPHALRAIWPYVPQSSHEGEGTSTVYHFGRKLDGTYGAFAFRSVDDFVAEELPQQGLAVKPEWGDDWTPPTVEAPEFDLAACVRSVRNRCDEEFAAGNHHVRIGGHLIVTVLEDGRISTKVAARFDDFDDYWQEVMARRLGTVIENIDAAILDSEAVTLEAERHASAAVPTA